jgi:peptide/nickel transport system substrate-binding protein
VTQEPTRTLYSEFTTPPSTFDPANASAGDDYVANSMLFSTLLSRDEGSTLVGNVASSWESRSPSDYVLTIRDGMTCADGTPIDATVVADSLQYLANTGKGTAPAVFGEGAPTIAADAAASTVTIHTAAPYVDLPTALTIPQTGVICPAGIADPKGLAAGTVPGAFSGPYTLGDVTPGVSYTFNLRSDFDTWPAFATPLQGRPASSIVYGIRTDIATTANKALAGQLDFAQVGGDAIKRFEGQNFNSVNTVVAITYLLFNERKGRYFADNEAARKAVAQAIDRTQYNTIFSQGVSPIYNTVAPADYACAIDGSSLIPAYEPKAAAATLGGAKIKMIASTAFGDQGKGAEYVAQMLRNAGAEVDLSMSDNATWASKIHDPAAGWDLTIKGDIPQLGVISDSLQRVMSVALEDGGRNIGAAVNPEGAAALAAGLATSDPAEQCKGFETAQRTMLERMDVVPLDGIIQELFTSPDVTIRAPGGRPNNITIRVAD